MDYGTWKVQLCLTLFKVIVVFEVSNDTPVYFVMCVDVALVCKLKLFFSFLQNFTYIPGHNTNQKELWVNNATADDQGLYTCLCTWPYNNNTYNSSSSRMLNVTGERGCFSCNAYLKTFSSSSGSWKEPLYRFYIILHRTKPADGYCIMLEGRSHLCVYLCLQTNPMQNVKSSLQSTRSSLLMKVWRFPQTTR